MVKCVRYLLVTVSIAIFLLGIIFSSFNVMLLGILTILSANLVYSFEDIKNRILFLLFQIVIFVFLISRPFISMCKGNMWWKFKTSSVNFALFALFITLLSLLLGAVLMQKFIKNKNVRYTETKTHEEIFVAENKKQKFLKSLQIISLILFYVTIFCFLIGEAEKLLFMHGKAYEEYYTEFNAKTPYIIRTLGSTAKYFLCIFLATMPKKKITFIPLAIYLISAVPALIIGMRNQIVLNALFVFLYYFIRDTLNDSQKWIGILEKAVLIITLPVAMAFLGAYNYIRAGSHLISSNPFSLIVDFMYKQGVSFDVLCIGYTAIPKILNTGFVNYTFGTFVDYFTHGTFAQIVFGAPSLGQGNNLNMALYSNSFAHRMSYVARGQEYLQGNGWGSSYLLETYADFGFVGIIVFSVLIGMLLIYLIPFIKKNWFCATIAFMILTNIFFAPRDAATNFISFVLTAQFIISVVFCYVISKLFVKDYSLKNEVLNPKIIS